MGRRPTMLWATKGSVQQSRECIKTYSVSLLVKQMKLACEIKGQEAKASEGHCASYGQAGLYLYIIGGVLLE